MKKITLLLVLILFSFAFAQNPVITDYIDSTCPNADCRTLELYEEGSVDLTELNTKRQSNGGGFTTNIDISALGTVSDDFVYITNDETILLQEFGISANVLVNGSIKSNGNDGFEIINPDDVVIDRFGEDGVYLSSDTEFTTSLDILQTGGNASATVYERLASGLTEGPYFGSLEVSSANATSETITLSGNVLGELTSDMVITGVFDGPLTRGTPKVIELYVLRDITDLSVFGVGNANNGGGSDGQEFTFQNVAASVGDYIYIASEQPNFNAFFGFDPDYTSNAANSNGDDAVELFQNGEVIDTFGDINTDGTNEAWEYTDGWAYRLNNSGPDGGTFVLNNWEFSGTGENDDDTSQGAATNPWPIGNFTTTLGLNNFDSTSIKIYPNPVSNGVLTVKSSTTADLEVQLFNMLGQRVLTSKALESINVSELNTGVYLLKVILGASFVTKKIVVN